MTVSIDKAREFVFANGSLWERALFTHLFDGGSVERVHQCLLCYKNDDGGFGHGLEYDIKCPDSHPLALEFLLTIIRDTGIPVGNLLDGTVQWVEQNREEDGSLKNPDNLTKYPLAPWWQSGGQTAPDSITGNLIKLGVCTPGLAQSTAQWVGKTLTVEKIKENKWLFMAYHAHDYFMNADDSPEVREAKEAAIQNIIECAELAKEAQYLTLFQFASSPSAELAQRIPSDLIDRFLNHLGTTQREDGGWSDEHGLSHWQPYTTILALSALKRYNRI